MKLEDFKKRFKKIYVFTGDGSFKNATDQEIKDWVDFNSKSILKNFYYVDDNLIINQSESDSVRLVSLYCDRVNYNTLTKYEKTLRILIYSILFVSIVSVCFLFSINKKTNKIEEIQTNVNFLLSNSSENA